MTSYKRRGKGIKEWEMGKKHYDDVNIHTLFIFHNFTKLPQGASFYFYFTKFSISNTEIHLGLYPI